MPLVNVAIQVLNYGLKDHDLKISTWNLELNRKDAYDMMFTSRPSKEGKM